MKHIKTFESFLNEGLDTEQISGTTWPVDIKQWPSEIKATTTTGGSANLKKTLRKFEYVLDDNKWRRPKYGEKGAEKISLPAYETKQGSIVDFYNIDYADKKLNSPI